MIQDPVKTQLYLMAPPPADFDEGVLSAVLAEGVACLMVDISDFTSNNIPALERMIATADAAECPLVASGDDAMALDLARRFSLDGVHLSDGPKQIEWARKQLGGNAIVGYGAGTSRSDALLAAEGGVDYILLGPLEALEPDLLVWWQAVIETPLVVDAGTDLSAIAGVADFALVSQVFSHAEPAQFIRTLKTALSA